MSEPQVSSAIAQRFSLAGRVALVTGAGSGIGLHFEIGRAHV